MPDHRREDFTRRGRSASRAVLWAAAGTATLALASPAMAKSCEELATLALPGGKVTAADIVPAGAFEPPASAFGPPPGVGPSVYSGMPEFCRVHATLTPSSDSDIKVEVWLPSSGWNGKFAGVGNGVWAGQISYFQMGAPLARGYAVASTDTGHTGDGMTGEFAIGHSEKLTDFGYRAVHEMTVAAKAVIEGYYGKAPALSLWNSCSTGGRQGLMEAYRYPQDYDAISAMAPANPMTMLMTQTMWTGYQALRSPQAELSPARLAVLHRAVIAQCDAKDGLEDGLVSRPQACGFDPVVAQCKAGEEGECLTAEQVRTMRAIYGGVRDSRNGVLLFPGFSPGSEIQLGTLIGGPAPFPVATSYMGMLVFGNRPEWDWRSFDYGADADRARDYGAGMLDVPFDGLGAFFARGGKLLLSHGWNDGLIPANNTVAFYRGLYGALPLRQAQDQLRLFMAPGMNHCAGGEGPSSFDTLGAIDAWATNGSAPNRLIATRAPGAVPGLPPMSRPLCPWPLVAQYKGKGSTEEEANFTCAAPER